MGFDSNEAFLSLRSVPPVRNFFYGQCCGKFFIGLRADIVFACPSSWLVQSITILPLNCINGTHLLVGRSLVGLSLWSFSNSINGMAGGNWLVTSIAIDGTVLVQTREKVESSSSSI